jgi:hypothetical protein
VWKSFGGFGLLDGVSKMNLLEKIADGFIMTFGITQPAPEKRRMTSFFIVGLLLAVLAGFLTLIVYGARHFGH